MLTMNNKCPQNNPSWRIEKENNPWKSQIDNFMVRTGLRRLRSVESTGDNDRNNMKLETLIVIN